MISEIENFNLLSVNCYLGLGWTYREKWLNQEAKSNFDKGLSLASKFDNKLQQSSRGSFKKKKN